MRLPSILSIFCISNLNKVGVNAKNKIRLDSNNKGFATEIDDRYLIDQNPSKAWEKHPYSLRELVLKKRLNDTESIGWGTDALTYTSTRVDDDDKNIPIFNYTNRTLIVAFQNQYHTQLKSNEFKQSLCENVVASMLVLGSMTDNCTILHSCLINDLKVPLMLELTAPLIPERCLFDWKINKDIYHHGSSKDHFEKFYFRLGDLGKQSNDMGGLFSKLTVADMQIYMLRANRLDSLEFVYHYLQYNSTNLKFVMEVLKGTPRLSLKAPYFPVFNELIPEKIEPGLLLNELFVKDVNLVVSTYAYFKEISNFLVNNGITVLTMKDFNSHNSAFFDEETCFLIYSPKDEIFPSTYNELFEHKKINGNRIQSKIVLVKEDPETLSADIIDRLSLHKDWLSLTHSNNLNPNETIANNDLNEDSINASDLTIETMMDSEEVLRERFLNIYELYNIDKHERSQINGKLLITSDLDIQLYQNLTNGTTPTGIELVTIMPVPSSRVINTYPSDKPFIVLTDSNPNINQQISYYINLHKNKDLSDYVLLLDVKNHQMVISSVYFHDNHWWLHSGDTPVKINDVYFFDYSDVLNTPNGNNEFISIFSQDSVKIKRYPVGYSLSISCHPKKDRTHFKDHVLVGTFPYPIQSNEFQSVFGVMDPHTRKILNPKLTMQNLNLGNVVRNLKLEFDNWFHHFISQLNSKPLFQGKFPRREDHGYNHDKRTYNEYPTFSHSIHGQPYRNNVLFSDNNQTQIEMFQKQYPFYVTLFHVLGSVFNDLSSIHLIIGPQGAGKDFMLMNILKSIAETSLIVDFCSFAGGYDISLLNKLMSCREEHPDSFLLAQFSESNLVPSNDLLQALQWMDIDGKVRCFGTQNPDNTFSGRFSQSNHWRISTQNIFAPDYFQRSVYINYKQHTINPRSRPSLELHRMHLSIDAYENMQKPSLRHLGALIKAANQNNINDSRDLTTAVTDIYSMYPPNETDIISFLGPTLPERPMLGMETYPVESKMPIDSQENTYLINEALLITEHIPTVNLLPTPGVISNSGSWEGTFQHFISFDQEVIDKSRFTLHDRPSYSQFPWLEFKYKVPQHHSITLPTIPGAPFTEVIVPNKNNCELLKNKLTNHGQEAIVVRLSTTFPIRFSSLSEQYFNQLIKENYNNRSLSKISNEEQLLLQYLLNTKDKDLRYYLATYINLSEDDLSNPFKVTQHIFQFLNGFYDGKFIKNLSPEKLSKHSLYLLNSIKSMRGQCRHQAVIADLFIRVLIGLDCRVVHNHQHSFLYISGGPILDVRYFLNKQQHKAKIFKGILKKETLLNAILSDNLKLKFNEFIMNPHKYLEDDFNLFASHYHTVKDKNNFDLLKIDTCKKPLSVSDENNRSLFNSKKDVFHALFSFWSQPNNDAELIKKESSDINQKTLHYIDQKKLSILAELKKDKPNFNRLFLECKYNDKTTREILITFIIKTYLTKLPKKTQTIYQRIPKQVFESNPDIPIYGRVIELGNKMVVRTQKPVNLPVKSVGIHNDSSSIRYPYIYLSNTRPILINNQTEFIQFNSSLPLNLDEDLIAAFNEQLNMNSYPQIT